MMSFRNKTFQISIPYLGFIFYAIYPVLALYAHNVQELVISQIYFPMIFSILLAAIFFFASLLILKDSSVASISTMLFLIIFWNYMLIHLGISKIVYLEHWHLLPILIFIYFHVVYFVHKIRQRETLININMILIIPITLLIIINLSIIIPGEFKKRHAITLAGAVSHQMDAGHSYENRPDIYLIILDEYASLKTIKEEWGYDNGPFAEFLQDSGFFVSKKSEARYSQTLENMASLLNIEYLTGPVEKDNFLKYIFERDTLRGDEIINIMEKGSKSVCFQRMSDNYVMKYLKNQGYNIVVLEGITQHYGAIRFNDADKTISYQNIKIKTYSYSIDVVDAFSLELIRKSVLFSLDSILKIDEVSNKNYNGTKYILNYLKKDINRKDSPKFVYAHIMCPHDPYVFDRNGKYVSQKISRPREGPYAIPNNTVNKAYLDQYIYMTNELKNLVNERINIKTDRKNNSVFVIESDHGPRPHHYYLRDRKNAFNVFNAVYFPDGDYKYMYDGIPPINTLRVILNKYFGEDYKMLQDR